jgi:predicted GIY-YIG superfamily endonuclease
LLAGREFAPTPRVSGSEKKTVCILRSDHNPERHYTGVTTDIVQRLRWHNAAWNTDTAQDRPWSVVVSIEFNKEHSALEFERYLKTGSGRAFAKRHFP